jgi:hypothetical protein
MDKPQMDKSQYDLATESIARFKPENKNEIIVFKKVKEMFDTLKDLYDRHDGFVKHFEDKPLDPKIAIKMGTLNGIKKQLSPLVSDLSKNINLYMKNGFRTEEILQNIWDASVDTAINVCVQKYIDLYKELITEFKGGRRLRKRSKMPRRRHRSTRRSTRRRRS